MDRHSVLIVDDEAIVRESIRDWLKDAGYKVATAESGEEALEVVERQDFSVMILDLRLPGQTGISVLKEVKAVRPWIRSIIITAYPSAETSAEATRLGAIDYLIKPFAPDDLERLIRETLATVPVEPQAFVQVEVRPKPPVPKVVEVKKTCVISRQDWRNLVEGLMKEMEVIGVKGKEGKYVYDKLSSFDELLTARLRKYRFILKFNFSSNCAIMKLSKPIAP